MSLFVIVAAGVTASAAGPWLRARIFAHSVAYGRPRRRHCPRCRHMVVQSVRDAAPATGRCPACRRRIGPPAASVEVVAGLVAALVVWSSPDPGTLLAAAWIAAFGIVLCFVDVAVHRLPDPLTRWALVGAGLILTVTAALTSRHDRLVSAVGGATILGGFYLAMAVARPRSLGLGDAKLALPIGLFLGWLGLRFVLSGLLAITMIGTATGLVLLAVGRLRRGQGFAHGPALCAGALITYISVAEP